MASPPTQPIPAQLSSSTSSSPPPPALTQEPTAATAATATENEEDGGGDGGDGGKIRIPSTSPSPDLPLTMTASLVLTSLPRDAASALAEADAALFPPDHKVVVRFKPVGGSAPPLPARRELSRVGAGQRFEVVVGYLNRVLRLAAADSNNNNNGNNQGGGQGHGQQGGSVFCYVNATFAPSLDEVVGNLWKVSFLIGYFLTCRRCFCEGLIGR